MIRVQYRIHTYPDTETCDGCKRQFRTAYNFLMEGKGGTFFEPREDTVTLTLCKGCYKGIDNKVTKATIRQNGYIE